MKIPLSAEPLALTIPGDVLLARLKDLVKQGLGDPKINLYARWIMPNRLYVIPFDDAVQIAWLESIGMGTGDVSSSGSHEELGLYEDVIYTERGEVNKGTAPKRRHLSVGILCNPGGASRAVGNLLICRATDGVITSPSRKVVDINFGDYSEAQSFFHGLCAQFQSSGSIPSHFPDGSQVPPFDFKPYFEDDDEQEDE